MYKSSKIWPILTSGDLIFDRRENMIEIVSNVLVETSNAVYRVFLSILLFELDGGGGVKRPPTRAKLAETTRARVNKLWSRFVTIGK